MRTKFKKAVVKALKTTQKNGIDVYAFFLPGKMVLEIADISQVKRDQSKKLHGFQRKEIKSHVSKIVEYLDQGSVLFPNAIILALGPDVEFKLARGPKPKYLIDVAQSGTLTIPYWPDRSAAWIVDGQQRSLALSKTKNDKLPVPIVGFIADNIETQREQFILVNKAKPLPTRLINELLPEVSFTLPRDLAPRKIPSMLCNLLNEDPNSPFFGVISRFSSNTKGKKGVITDTALINVMKRSLKSPLGALTPFKRYTENITDTDAMYQTMLSFWEAVKKSFPNAWGLPPEKSRLMHSAGIEAMGFLMDKIMARCSISSNSNYCIKGSLKKISPYCNWTDGTWDEIGLEWNEIQNTSRHIRTLADYLIQIDHRVNVSK